MVTIRGKMLKGKEEESKERDEDTDKAAVEDYGRGKVRGGCYRDVTKNLWKE